MQLLSTYTYVLVFNILRDNSTILNQLPDIQLDSTAFAHVQTGASLA